MKRFPILQSTDGLHATGGRQMVPWAFAEKVYADYVFLYGDEQSLERLAQRGGLGWNEMLEIMVRAAEKREQEKSAPRPQETTAVRTPFEETQTRRAGGAW